MTNQGGGGLEKWPVTLGFTSYDRPFFQTPLNPLSQIVSPVTLLISHYMCNVSLEIYMSMSPCSTLDTAT